jgi:VRR-NUC domain
MIAEISIQIKAVYEVRKVLRDGWILIHPPNEEVRSGRTLAKQMALGMHPGVPDLIVFSPKGKPHFMEFKTETGALNDAQEDFQFWAIKANVRHSVVRSVDEAMRVFEFWEAIPERVTTVSSKET